MWCGWRGWSGTFCGWRGWGGRGRGWGGVGGVGGFGDEGGLCHVCRV